MLQQPVDTYSSFIGRALLAAAGPVTFAAPASSSELDRHNIENVGNFRVGVDAGAFIPNRVSWNGSGTINSLPVVASGQISSNTGSAVGGLFGYAFNDYLNVDLDVGYVSSSFRKFDGTVSVAGLGNFGGSMSLTGRVETIAGFLNALITPLGTNGRLTPYFGAGPGLAHSKARLQSFTVGPVTLPVNSTSSETDFAADGVLGFDIKLTRQLELGVAYEYVWINAKHLGSGSGIDANNGSVSGQIVGLLLEYRF